MDQIRLMYLMHYDPETGLFTRLTSNRKDRIGVTPGARNTNGHVQIRVDGVLYMAHRLAWLYVHGSFPQKQLDHINGDKTDNRNIEFTPLFQQEKCGEQKAVEAKHQWVSRCVV